MASADLASLAERLRKDGFEARNLGSVGITIWHRGRGYYFSAEESPQLQALVARHAVESALAQREA